VGEAELRRDELTYQLVITFNVLTHEFRMEGFNEDPLIELGMLEWAKRVVQRAVVKGEMIEEMKNMPRIAVPGGPLG
jgi:hypothetical protein